MTAPGILDYFPLAKIRPVQEQIITEAFAAFESGKRFVIVEGPPGTGKTACAVTLARYYRSSYIVTITHQLQSQYMKDFSDAVELKGRPNFTCAKSFSTCEVGAERVKDPCSPGKCPYRLAKAEAVLADLTICNYHSYLYNVGMMPWATAALLTPGDDTQGTWERPLLVLDEAHEVEEVLISHTSVFIDSEKVPIEMPPAPNNVASCFAWLELFLRDAAEIDPETLGAEPLKEFNRLKKKAEFALKHREDEWIYEPLEDGKKGFKLKPLTVKTFGEKLFRFGERVLLMSATILDAAKLADSLGIKDYAYVKAPCTFPVENRPIISAAVNMTKAHRNYSWPAMVEQISAILGFHPDEKGLILTPSNEMLLYIFEGLPQAQRQRTILARGTDRMERYQAHLDAKDASVLVASGFWEGADLKDDFARFLIIPAIPRPYWGGQILARAKLDPVWYRWKAFTQLIQGTGRIIRSEKDWGTVYILDSALREEASRKDTMLPDWFREALIYA